MMSFSANGEFWPRSSASWWLAPLMEHTAYGLLETLANPFEGAWLIHARTSFTGACFLCTLTRNTEHSRLSNIE
jgi:hypothetical protein